MQYQEAVSWLFSRFPSYQNLGASAYKPDLNNTISLLDALGHPENDLNCIHIAGTNGKGSTSHILAALCQTHGLKTGIFTSPHLVDFRERIKIDGVQISEETVVDWVENVIPSLPLDFEPSFFELTFALALVYFKNENCDACIIETGLGGRLDATNVILPKLSVITNIGFDHQNFLGDTRPLIAGEKAGIIKAHMPVLIAEKDPETQAVFEEKVKNVSAQLRWVDFSGNLESDLLGSYQQLNLHTAKQAFEWYCDLMEIKNQTEQVDYALKNVAKLTDFHGRMELIQENPLVIFDVAHNISGIRVLLHELKSLTYSRLHIVFGAANDKDLSEVFEILPKNAQYYFTQFSNMRSRTMEEWQAIVPKDFTHKLFKTPRDAYQHATFHASKEDLVLVFGSFFLVGELISTMN
jgi:dihydrofolate synthase / folylpolyglutamate synthase